MTEEHINEGARSQILIAKVANYAAIMKREVQAEGARGDGIATRKQVKRCGTREAAHHGASLFAVLAQRRSECRRGGKRVPDSVVDDLHIRLLVRPEDAEARPLGSAAQLHANRGVQRAASRAWPLARRRWGGHGALLQEALHRPLLGVGVAVGWRSRSVAGTDFPQVSKEQPQRYRVVFGIAVARHSCQCGAMLLPLSRPCVQAAGLLL